MVHLSEEGTPDERYLIDDQERDILPLLLQASELLSAKLFLPRGFREDLEAGASSFGSEADIESGDASICSELHCRTNTSTLEFATKMLYDCLQRGGLATASRAAQPRTNFWHRSRLAVLRNFLVDRHDFVTPL